MSLPYENKQQVATAFQQQKFNFGPTESIKLIQQRRTVSYKSDRTEYKQGDTIIIPFGSTTEWLYGANSYIKFRVVATGNGGADFGYGCGLNLIDQMTLTAKSGIELENLRDVATLANMQDTYTCGSAYLEHTGTLMGYNASVLELGAGFDIILPLHHLSGFLGSDRYIPMNLLGGLELQLKLNSASFALTGVTDGAANQFTITECELFTDSYRMVDPVLKYSEELAKQGEMMMMFDTFAWNRTNVSSNTATSINLEKSFTKCLGAYSRVRVAPADEGKEDRVASATQAVCALSSYQWRVGSEQHPNKPVVKQTQAMAEALKGFNNFSNCVRTPFVDYAKYITTHNVIGVSLERDIDSSDFLSGISTNNKNAISLEIQTTADAVVTTFLHHVRVLIISDGELRVDQ